MKEIKTQGDIMQLANAFRESRVLLTAYELNIFSVIGDSEKTSTDTAKVLGTDQRATDRLMNALTAIGLLNKKGDEFSNTETSLKYLVKDKPDYMQGLSHTANLWNSWTTMTECVKQGTGISLTGEVNDRGNLWLKSFIAAMHMRGRQAAKEAAKMIDLGGVNSIMDVGGGSGAFTYEFLRKKPELKATIFDLPNVIPLTKQYIEQEGFSGKVETREGNYLADELCCGYDMIFLSAIIHSNSPDANMFLFSNCHKALNENGKLVILDYVMNEERTEPYAGAMFALNMLVVTENGDTFTENEIKGWLEKTGFMYDKKEYTETGTAIITAIKK